MKKRTQTHLLLLCVVVLSGLCLMSIVRPIYFEKEREKRELVVKERLMKIRKAAEAYRKLHGVYAGTMEELIKSGALPDSLQWIPFAKGQRFALSATTEITRSGKTLPLMECGAQYTQYLDGLDQNSIDNLMVDAGEAGRYPGLKIGDLKTPNDNAGNWE